MVLGMQVRIGELPEGGGSNVETRLLARHRGRAHKLAMIPSDGHCFLSCGEDGDDTRSQTLGIMHASTYPWCLGAEILPKLAGLRRRKRARHQARACRWLRCYSPH